MRDFLAWRVAPAARVFCSIMVTLGPAAAQAPAAPVPVAPAPGAAAPVPAGAPPVQLVPALPQGVYYAAPGYAYPPPPYGMYAKPMRIPDSYPYEGGPVPAGFHVEQRPRRGLIIAGSLVLGIPWAIGLSIASGSNFPNQSGWLAVPALGPWITLASRRNDTCTSYSTGTTCFDNGTTSATRTFLVLDGLMQVGGTVMLVVGLASPTKVIARDFVGSLRFTPSSMGRQGYGGFVTGEF